MNSLQKWCRDNLHVIEASANGEVVQIKPTGCELWVDIDYPCFRGDLAYEYRVKPRTIKIGDFDVPEPMLVEPDSGCEYFVVEALSDIPAASQIWNGMDCEKRWLSMGLCHKSKESAIAHAKAIISLSSMK